jgi:hypothetical protein
MKDYGVKFGPLDNSTGGLQGQCIEGKGRFPDLHGQNVDAGYGANPFVERMFKSFFKNSSATSGKSAAQQTLKTDDNGDHPLQFALSYGSDMVLQAGTPTSIWGWAAPGSTVTLSLDKAPSLTGGEAVVDSGGGINVAVVTGLQVEQDGSWKAYLPAQPPSKDFMGHTLTATHSDYPGDSSVVTLTGIVFGDVCESSSCRLPFHVIYLLFWH